MRSAQRFRPTRMCPHRWCRLAHWIIALSMFLGFGISMTRSPAAGLTVVGVGVGAVVVLVAVLLLLTRKMSPGDIQHVADRVKQETTGPVVEVDAWWARAAVFADVVFIAYSALLLAAQLVALFDPAMMAQAQKQNPPRWQDGVALTALEAVMLIGAFYAHWRATHRPRRKVRARVLSPAVSKSS